MANPIKYNASNESKALKVNNFWFGTGDVDKGPTSSTGFYNGITPPSGGYTIYLNKASFGPSIYVASNDAQLIDLTNKIANTSYTGVTECLNYFRGESDKAVFNRKYENIITDGLLFNLDAGFVGSYPKSGTTWYDLSGNGNNATLINDVGFDSADGGSLTFDGSNDYVDVNYSSNPQYFTVEVIVKPVTIDGSTQVYVGKFNGSGNDWWIGVADPDNRFRFSMNSAIAIVSNPITDANKFYVLTASLGPTYVKFYVDGNLIGTDTSQSTNPGGNITVGRFNIPCCYIKGKMASVKMYDRELSQSEILRNYNAQKSRFGL